MNRMISWGFALSLATVGMPALAEESMPASMEAGAPMAAMSGEVARAQFTTAIDQREPTDDLSQLPGTASQVYFFTELRGMEGQQVIHRWEYNGQVMAEVGFDVGSARWRVWSSKSLMPAWGGAWTVSVVSGSGEVLTSRELHYGGQ